MMFLPFLCVILQFKAHELVASAGDDDDHPENVDDFGIFRLYEVFSESTGIIHDLPDESLSATGSISEHYSPKLARIDVTEKRRDVWAWIGRAGKFDALTVDMITSHIVTGVATQGRADGGQWVTRYLVETSESGIEWESQGEFVGNFNHFSVTKGRFEIPVLARFVKFTVLDYHSYPAMRVDVLVYEPNDN